MKKQLAVGQKWKTRNELVATVTNIDGIQGVDSYPVLVRLEDGTQVPVTAEGRQFSGSQGPLDLVELIEDECDCMLCSGKEGELPEGLAEMLTSLPEAIGKIAEDRRAERAAHETRQFADELILAMVNNPSVSGMSPLHILEFTQGILDGRKTLKF